MNVSMSPKKRKVWALLGQSISKNSTFWVHTFLIQSYQCLLWYIYNPTYEIKDLYLYKKRLKIWNAGLTTFVSPYSRICGRTRYIKTSLWWNRVFMTYVLHCIILQKMCFFFKTVEFMKKWIHSTQKLRVGCTNAD